jgi:hypothetical protein
VATRIISNRSTPTKEAASRITDNQDTNIREVVIKISSKGAAFGNTIKAKGIKAMGTDSIKTSRRKFNDCGSSLWRTSTKTSWEGKNESWPK